MACYAVIENRRHGRRRAKGKMLFNGLVLLWFIDFYKNLLSSFFVLHDKKMNMKCKKKKRIRTRQSS